MHEHAVRERHPAEPNLFRLLRHRSSVARNDAPAAPAVAEPRRPAAALARRPRSMGTISRTAELVKASSARRRVGSVNGALSHAIAALARELGDGAARHARKHAGEQRRRRQHVAVAPPHVRGGRLENGLALAHEERVVGAAPLRFGDGGHVHSVARRLDAGEQPVGGCAEGNEREAPSAQRVETCRQRRDGRDERRARPEQAKRAFVDRRGLGRLDGELARAVGRGQPKCERRPLEPLDVPVEHHRRRPRRIRNVSKAAVPRTTASSSAWKTGSAGSTTPRPATATASRLMRAPASRSRLEQRSRLHPGLLDLVLRTRIPDDRRRLPRDGYGPRPRRTCGSSARARSRRSAGSRRSLPSQAPRPTGSSSAIRSNGRDLRGAGDRAAREHGGEDLGQPGVGAQTPFHRRDEVGDARELLLVPELRPADRARLADTRKVVPLEIDDHRVLCVVLGIVHVFAGGPRTLDRRVTSV